MTEEMAENRSVGPIAHENKGRLTTTWRRPVGQKGGGKPIIIH